MNQPPAFPAFPVQQAPQGAPQPHYAPPQQQYPQQGQPQPYPQQPQYPQQQQYPQQPGQQPAGPISTFAQANLMTQFLNEPPRQVVSRARIADGTFVVQLQADTEHKLSQKDGTEFLLMNYQVLDGSIPQMVGQKFGWPIFWNSRGGLQDLAEIVKALWGPTGAQQLAAQGRGPSQIADAIVQTVRGQYCKLVVIRNQKKLAQGVPYDQVFPSHYWSEFSATPFRLQMQATPPTAPQQQFPPQQFAPQQPPQQQAPFPPQQPQQQFAPPMQQAPNQGGLPPIQYPPQPAQQQQPQQPQQAPPPAFPPPAPQVQQQQGSPFPPPFPPQPGR